MEVNQWKMVVCLFVCLFVYSNRSRNCYFVIGDLSLLPGTSSRTSSLLLDLLVVVV